MLRQFRIKRLKLQEAEGVVCGKQPDDLRQVAFLLLVSVLHGTASFVPAALGFLPQVIVVFNSEDMVYNFYYRTSHFAAKSVRKCGGLQASSHHEVVLHGLMQ